MLKVTLSSEDLFFMAKFMKAKYLDYDYVSLMEDISKRYALKEAQSMDNLDSKGLIFEDFSGEIEIEEKAKLLLEPIFFGTFESELILEDSTGLKKYKYHVLDDRYIQVKIESRDLIISHIDKEDILNNCPIIEDLPQKRIIDTDYFTNKNVEGIMVLKRQKISKESECIQLINDSGVFYILSNNKLESLNKDELISLMKNKLWEE